MGLPASWLPRVTFKLTGPGVDVHERSERATLFRLRFSVLFAVDFQVTLWFLYFFDDPQLPRLVEEWFEEGAVHAEDARPAHRWISLASLV